MKKISAAVVVSGALVLGAAPAHAAPEPKPSTVQAPPGLPAPLKKAMEDDPLSVGWDAKGPYIVWGNLRCRIHLFVPEEWTWAWGTGPCWF